MATQTTTFPNPTELVDSQQSVNGHQQTQTHSNPFIELIPSVILASQIRSQHLSLCILRTLGLLLGFVEEVGGADDRLYIYICVCDLGHRVLFIFGPPWTWKVHKTVPIEPSDTRIAHKWTSIYVQFFGNDSNNTERPRCTIYIQIYICFDCFESNAFRMRLIMLRIYATKIYPWPWTSSRLTIIHNLATAQHFPWQYSSNIYLYMNTNTRRSVSIKLCMDI